MIVDANVLLYAVDDASPFHAPARAWLEEALNGETRVGFPWVSLTAFLRISTHPRVSARPLSASDAWQHIDNWLDADLSWIPVPTSRHADVLKKLVVDTGIHGNLITDAHLAALAVEHGVSVCSVDSDFAIFQGLTWVNPLQP